MFKRYPERPERYPRGMMFGAAARIVRHRGSL
jgi:hypothetical protein